MLDQLRALGATDTKRDRFFDRIRALSSEGRPILIFTEYTDTMEYSATISPTITEARSPATAVTAAHFSKTTNG